MLDQGLRRWPNIETTSGDRLLFAERVIQIQLTSPCSLAMTLTLCGQEGKARVTRPMAQRRLNTGLTLHTLARHPVDVQHHLVLLEGHLSKQSGMVALKQEIHYGRLRLLLRDIKPNRICWPNAGRR